jgi:hypothetical protein
MCKSGLLRLLTQKDVIMHNRLILSPNMTHIRDEQIHVDIQCIVHIAMIILAGVKQNINNLS